MNKKMLVVTADILTDDAEIIYLDSIRFQIELVLDKYCRNKYLYRNLNIALHNVPEEKE